MAAICYKLWAGEKHGVVGHFFSFQPILGAKLVYAVRAKGWRGIEHIEVPLTRVVTERTSTGYRVEYMLDVRKKSPRQRALLDLASIRSSK